MNATKELIDQALGNYNSMRRFEEEKTNFLFKYFVAKLFTEESQISFAWNNSASIALH